MPSQSIDPLIAVILVVVVLALLVDGGISAVNVLVTIMLLLVALWLLRGVTGYW